MIDVGTKVVCIVDGPWCHDGNPKFEGRAISIPIKGEVYTVSFVDATTETVYLGLHELEPDCGYVASAFRPVIKRKTDISVFQKILDNAPKNPVEVRRDVEVLYLMRPASIFGNYVAVSPRSA